MRRLIGDLKTNALRFLGLDRSLDEVKINQGRILAELHQHRRSTKLCDHEFKVFSQWGEDGILQFLTQNLEIPNRTFIEFGVEDFFESNCRFLLMKDYWRGFVIDGSERNMQRLRSAYFFWRYPLTTATAFVTRENVNGLLESSGFDKEVGILSIDVDGVDYHLLEALPNWKAAIVICEYNSLFGATRAVTVPYAPGFVRNKAHWSNLYWGASLPAFTRLLNYRGYGLVGVNGAGSNAFFVRRDLLNARVFETSVAECFRQSVFREARNESGALKYLSAWECRADVRHLPVVDILSGSTIPIAEILGT